MARTRRSVAIVNDVDGAPTVAGAGSHRQAIQVWANLIRRPLVHRRRGRRATCAGRAGARADSSDVRVASAESVAARHVARPNVRRSSADDGDAAGRGPAASRRMRRCMACRLLRSAWTGSSRSGVFRRRCWSRSRVCARSGGHRHLRPHAVFGCDAHARDQHPHGGGRAEARHSADDHPRRADAQRHRHCARHRGSPVWLGPVLSGMVFGVSATDPATFVAVAALLTPIDRQPAMCLRAAPRELSLKSDV